MRISAEHHRLENRLEKAWRRRLAANREARRQYRNRRGSWRQRVGIQPLLRVLFWGAAAAPFPMGWIAMVMLATWQGFFRAACLNARGYDEALAALYGAGDQAILNLSRRWRRCLMVWSAADALAVLGIWWATGSVPWWVAALGLPCFVLAAPVTPHLLTAVFPARVIGMITSLGVFVAFGLVVAGTHFTAAILDQWIWAIGVLTPGGWVVLLVRSLAGGGILPWLVIPLLAAAAALLPSLVRVREVRLLAVVGRENEAIRFPTVDEEENEEGEDQDYRDGGDRPPLPGLASELAALRRLPVLDYPALRAPGPFLPRKAIWHAMVILAAAVFLRLAPGVGGNLAWLVFASLMISVFVSWLPLLGSPAWLHPIFVSPNRLAASLTLFPVSLREVLKTQARRDLRTALRATLPLLAITSLAFLMAMPGLPVLSIAMGLVVTVFFILKLPLRWFHLATLPLTSRPLGPGIILRGLLIVLLTPLFFWDAIFVILFCALSSGVGNAWGFLVFCPALSLANAVLGLLGTWLALRAFEARSTDAVKRPVPLEHRAKNSP